MDSFEVKKIWLERYDNSRTYLRERTLICCELDLT